MRKRFGRFFVLIAVVLFVSAAALFLYNDWENSRASQNAQDVQELLNIAEQYQTNDVSSDEDFSKRQMATITIEGNEYIGTLSIPRFGLELPVMNQWSYDGLKIAPGRYSGNIWANDMVIAGHSYERHFRNIRYLENGDTVIFTDVLGNVFTYEVAYVEILQPEQVDAMINSPYDLTLFTCTANSQSRATARLVLLDIEIKT